MKVVFIKVRPTCILLIELHICVFNVITEAEVNEESVTSCLVSDWFLRQDTA